MPALLVRSLPRLLVPGLLAVLSCTGVALGQPALTVATPSAVQPGGETEVKLDGSKLEGTLRFWSSFPAEIQVVEQAEDGNRVTCKLTLPDDVPVGVGGILLANEQGLTDTLWMMIDDLATVAEASDNQRPESAQLLTLPIAVDGVANGTEADYFCFEGDEGQLVCVEVYAARLGSTCDPLVRLLDADGNELAMADDHVALGADCRLTLTLPAAGKYFIELRDSKYASGGRYRLRIGDFPDAPVALPAGIRQGTVAEIAFPSPREPGAAQLVKAQSLRPGVHALSVRREGGEAALSVPLVVSDLPEFVESQPSSEPRQATRITIPAGFSGILNEAGDRDYFEFLAAEGDRFEFHGLARTIGSSAYPLLRLSDADGNQLAESPVGESDEPTLAFTFPADGLYRLSVEDLLRSGGPQHAYRVEARRVPFTLVHKAAKDVPYKNTLNAGIGAWAFDITCQRHGYDGPISVRLEPPSPSFQWINSTIPAGANEARVILAVREDVPAGELATVNLVGEASLDGVTYSTRISSETNVRAKWPTMISPPVWQQDLLAISTGPTPGAFFETRAEQTTIYYPRGIGTSAAKLNTFRMDEEFKDAPLLALTEGPAGVTAEFKTEGDAHEVTVQGPAELPVGTYPLTITAFGSLKGRSIVQRAHLLLDVQDPVTLTLTGNEPLKPGESRTLTLAASRRGDERHPIQITFHDLPAGVTVSDVSLDAEQDQVEVTLTAAEDAAPGQYRSLITQAASRFQEQDVTSRQLFALEIQAP